MDERGPSNVYGHGGASRPVSPYLFASRSGSPHSFANFGSDDGHDGRDSRMYSKRFSRSGTFLCLFLLTPLSNAHIPLITIVQTQSSHP